MTQTRLSAIALTLLAAWSLWELWASISYQMDVGVPMNLIFDPPFSLRVLGSIAALLAGTLAIFDLRAGQWLTGLAFIILGALAALMIALKADRSLWYDELALCFAFGVLYLGIMTGRNNRAPSAP